MVNIVIKYKTKNIAMFQLFNLLFISLYSTVTKHFCWFSKSSFCVN